MVSPVLRKLVFCYPTNIAFIAIVWGSASVLINVFVIPQIKDGTSLVLQSLEAFVAIGMFSILALGIGCVIQLFRKKWRHALSYFVAGCVLYLSAFASLALRGDSFAFTAGPHREIAEIYELRRSGFAPNKQQFFNLGEACHPPRECDCWLLWDPHHSSVVDADIGG